MSEFIHRTKIAALEQSNFELLDEISTLEKQINDLVIQIEQLKRDNPDDINHLKEIITDQEQRETDMKKKLASLCERTQMLTPYDDVEQLLNALELSDRSIEETAISQSPKNQGKAKLIIAFLSGVSVSLIAWIITEYLENDQQFNAVIKQMIDNISN